MEVFDGAPLQGRAREVWITFLKQMGLDADEGVTYTVCLRDETGLAATGSLERNVLKCIAVAPEHQGEDLTATVVTELMKEAFRRGERYLFLFTKPQNEPIFVGLGFFTVARTADSLLLENQRNGARDYARSLECPTREGVIGSVVANCNPFTNGHRYLIETAAAACDLLHLFLLSEDRSEFPASVRLRLAQAGVADLPHVVVHGTGDYMVSSATFPAYFIKDKTRVEDIQCELDLTLFAQVFAKELNITRRFVGTEPFSPVTNVYNQQMKRVLPRFGIEVVELRRMEAMGAAVSASRVRALLKAGELEQVKPLVPWTTYQWLCENGAPPACRENYD